MQGWVHRNQEAFERDVLRDFCLASDQLFEQFSRFATTESVSFPVMKAMVGEPRDKGLLWRLKDKSHHIFRDQGQSNPVGLLLDWTLGYIFHESLKLMEDAHQRQYYAPQLSSLTSNPLGAEVSGLAKALRAIQGETCESMRRESTRLETLMLYSRKLFCLYFARCSRHRPLARFLNDNAELVRRTFREDFDRLIASVYDNEPERLHIEAAYSLLESARLPAAAEAVEAALASNPASSEALALKEQVGKRIGNGAMLDD